jgi:hypothetical protein
VFAGGEVERGEVVVVAGGAVELDKLVQLQRILLRSECSRVGAV